MIEFSYFCVVSFVLNPLKRVTFSFKYFFGTYINVIRVFDQILEVLGFTGFYRFTVNSTTEIYRLPVYRFTGKLDTLVLVMTV